MRRSSRRLAPSGNENSQTSAMSVLLDFSEPMKAPFSEVHLDTAYGLHATEVDPVKDIQEKVHWLYSALVQMKEGESNDITCNSPSICLEARRKLACGHDPLTGRTDQEPVEIRNQPRSSDSARAPGSSGAKGGAGPSRDRTGSTKPRRT